MYSSVNSTAVSVDADSDKIGVWVDNPDDNPVFHRASASDHFDGER